MKAISIRHPWASWVALGAKDVENRTWEVSYRGPLLIHAGKDQSMSAAITYNSLSAEERRLVDEARALVPAEEQDVGWEYGALIGRVDLVGICTAGEKGSTSPWFEGPRGWIFANARALKRAIPYRGQLGLFDVPDDLVAEVLR